MFAFLSCLFPTLNLFTPKKNKDSSLVSMPTERELACIAFRKVHAAAKIRPSPQPDVATTLTVIHEDQVLEMDQIPPPFDVTKPRKRATKKMPRSLPNKSSKDGVANDRPIMKLPSLATQKNYSKQHSPSRPNAVVAPRVMNENLELEHMLANGDLEALRVECDRCRACFGSKNPRVGQVLLVIGIYEASQGRELAAMATLGEAAMCTMGSKHQQRVEAGFVKAEAHRHMGVVVLNTEDPKGAGFYLSDALSLHERNEKKHGRYPAYSIHVARSCMDLGMWYTKIGNLEEALFHFRRAANGYRRLFNTDPLPFVSAVEAIGSTYFQMGMINRAKRIFKNMFAIRVSTVGKNHHSLVSSYKNLGRVYVATEKYRRATRFYRHAERLLDRECHRAGITKVQLTASVRELREIRILLAAVISLREGTNAATAAPLLWV